MEAHEIDEKPIAMPLLFSGFLTFWGTRQMGH